MIVILGWRITEFKKIEETIMARRDHFFDGILFGAVIGVIAGLLFAPASGEDTRGKLKRRVDSMDSDAGDDVTDYPEDPSGKTEEMISKTLEAIENGFDKISSMVDKGTDNKS